jgi:hypothetical protein
MELAKKIFRCLVMRSKTGRELDMGKKIPAFCTPSDAKRVLRLPDRIRIGEQHRLVLAGELSRRRNPGGQLHSLDSPAITFSDGGYGWWRHGLAHRDGDMPALHVTDCNPLLMKIPTGVHEHPFADEPRVLSDGLYIWCSDGFIHREGKPAVRQERPDGWIREEYWHNGRRHNAAGPAVSHPENTSWFYHGLLHNPLGPATECKIEGVWMDCWSWYGDILLVNGEIKSSFPFGDAPAKYLLTALQVAKFSDKLIESLHLMQPHVVSLMPDFQQLSANCCDEVSWALLQGHIRNALSAGAVQESYDYSFAL